MLKQLIMFWLWAEFYNLKSFWAYNHSESIIKQARKTLASIIFIISMFALL